ncbi:M56 family metallopeptidase [Planctomycetota bacterium]
MAIFENAFAQEAVQKLGWTLLHFVWQGATVALFLAILLRLFRKSPANVRYIISCAALVLIVLLAIVTLQYITVSLPHPEAVSVVEQPADNSVAVTIDIEMPVVEEPARVESPAAVPTISLKQRAIGSLEPALPYIVTAWLLGVFALSVWHLGGWRQLQRLKRRMVRQVDASLHSRLRELAELLGIRRAVTLVESALVQVPTVVGWLKPVILLPASALTGLSSEQLQAILAHELAHIRRHDYLVNILQTVIEILGFYHPAIWWISRKIRAERENCCDDLAVRVTGGHLRYAKALTSMEEIRSSQPQLAVAATGGSLLKRISRLVTKDSKEGTRNGWAPSFIALLLIMALVIPGALALMAKTSQKHKIEAGGNSRVRHFVRVVTDDENDRVTFEGQELDSNEFPENLEPLLENVPDRAHTVLEIAFAPGTMPEKGSMVWLGIVQTLDRLEEKYGFEYLSIVGEHPLASKGSTTETYFQGQLQFDKEIPIQLQSAENPPLIKCRSIKFKRIDDAITADVSMDVTSYPKTKWEFRLRLLDVQAKEVKAVYQTFENSGFIEAYPWISDEKLIFQTITLPKKAKSFELRIRQLLPETQKTNEQVEIIQVEKSPAPPAIEDKTQIMIDFMIAEYFVDAKIDWETYSIIKNLMGEGGIPGDKPDFVGSVLAKYASNGGDKLGTLVDLLISRGYVKIIINPSLETCDGQSTKIATRDEKLSGEAEDIPQESSTSVTVSFIPEVQEDKETIQMYIDLDVNTPEKKIKTGTKYTVLNKKFSVFPLGGMIMPTEQGQSIESVFLTVRATILDDTSDIIKESAEQVEGEGSRELSIFESYFPDDLEAGKKLTTWWENKDSTYLDDDSFFDLFRKGLRRCTIEYKGNFPMQYIGGKYIWHKEPDDTQAIDIVYHTSFSPEYKYYAVYSGLSVTNPKSKRVLKRLVDLAMEPHQLGRILWGVKQSKQEDEFMDLLEPYLQASDVEKRERAEIVAKALRGEIDAGKWEREWNQKQQTERTIREFSDDLSRVKKTFLNGTSEERLEAIKFINRNLVSLTHDESFIQALDMCAQDDDANVRAGVASILGNNYIWGKPKQPEKAIDVLLQLSQDENRQVRYNTVYFGLSVIKEKNKEIIERVVELALNDNENNFYGRIVWGLRGADKETIKKYLIPHLTQKTQKTEPAQKLYQEIFQTEPPDLEQKPDVQVEGKQAKGEIDTAIQKRIESAKKLSQLCKALYMYANDHEEEYPDTLQDLRPYMEDGFEYEWILENIEYLGKGKTQSGPLNSVLAYDKALLENGEGTNVVYTDCHVAFEKPEQLEKLGIVRPEQTTDEQVEEQLERDPITINFDRQIAEQKLLLIKEKSKPDEDQHKVRQIQDILNVLRQNKEKRKTQITEQIQRANLKSQHPTEQKTAVQVEGEGLSTIGVSNSQPEAIIPAGEENKAFLTLQVIDNNGNPVEGAGIHKYFSVREDGWRSYGRFISDEEGFVKFQKEDIFEYPHENNGILLYAVSENELAGFLEITPQHIGRPIQWQLKPTCKVHGKLESSALKKLNQQLEWTNVYVSKDNYRPLSYSSDKGAFEFLLPPGKYSFHAYGTSTYSSDRDIEIKAGQKELEVNFDLPADKLATLMGKPAPELRNIKGWLNTEPLELADLQGKVVLLDFWGYWCGPCIAAMPDLIELHEEFSYDGLVIIGIHDDSVGSVEELQEKLKGISEDRWGGKGIPFPIVLDGGGMSEIEGTDKSARGATTAAYGIQAWPTCVLIDRSGNVVKRFHPSSSDSKNELEKILGVESKTVISRSESLKILHSLGRAVLMYANYIQENYPESIEQLRRYIPDQKEWQWLNQNVVYLGKGKTVTDRPDEILAYDKSLLEKNNSYGTNVLFNDAHVEFKEVGWFKKQGIEISEGKSSQLKTDWRQKFNEVYRLDEGQVLKRIAPPFIPEREDYYKYEDPYQASLIGDPPDYFTFHWEDGKLKNWGMGFTGGKRPLDSVLRSNLSIETNKYDGPEELLQVQVPGDWIVRKPSTIEERLKALEKILSEEIGRNIRFEKRKIEQEVIVATGDFKFHPPSETYEHDSVHLFTDELDPDEGSGGGTADSVNGFLGKLGNLIDMTVIDQTTPSEEIKIPYRHHSSSYLRKVKDETEKKRKLDILLVNLTKQTELQFRIERRPVEIWFVTEAKKSK